MTKAQKLLLTFISISILGAIIAIASSIAGDGISGKYFYQKNDPEITGIIKLKGSDCYYALVMSGGFKTGAFGTYTYDKQNKTIYFHWSEPLTIAPRYATVISENGSLALSLESGVTYRKE